MFPLDNLLNKNYLYVQDSWLPYNPVLLDPIA